ncbi:phosphate ABC transporter permease PstA [Haloferax volcanii]|uniref:Phosphate transport system permease protein PstA n=2 Tax=Haloferax volcanii TaxID=2246 RepID=A0A6C0UTK2_HALVO|nr:MULTISPECIES: phosphate ABC transporter permease PstA [Haloferax]ELZ89619.1 phosphate ABC transporter permease [Haloferax alexandrinus JCM 10717]NLV02719.1 phosphate ABC transporter permease PstA [Haloferax alexandrinus]QIB77621.1 phosphate ABC transporter permease PstA [Haloferax alexandrinus]TVT95074.1 phosphate ABC transporter permease PstA [Haloferax volcanii]
MAGATESTLVSEDTSETEAVAAGAVGLAAVLFALSLAAMFELVTITDPVAGVPMVALLGGLLVLLGLAVVGFGVGSRLGYVATNPRPTAGLVASAAFALVWFVVGGLVASQTLGLGTAGWVVASLVTGGVGFAVSAFPREDIGSTLPAGALAAFAGLVFLTGVIGPSWVWDLGWEQQASFNAEFTIPVLTGFCSLLVGWAAAKAYGGFGARGRHIGAYVLVYLNALSIIAVLFLLVAFTVLKGLPGLFNGLAFGAGAGPEVTLVGVTFSLPLSWPFVMNGVALLNDVNGVLPAIAGTIWLVVGAVLFAVPLGVGAAVFITEYADRGRFTQVVEIATNGLWSTPSIVFGLFGLAFLVPRLGNQKSLLAGMLTLGFMLLPLVVITSRESMLAVPDEYRDASAALGVTKWQTVRSIVLPAALPGIITGIILGVGRIAGETAPILLTMSGSVAPPGSQTVDVVGGFQFSLSPPFVTNPELMQATSALPYQLYSLITAGVGQSSNIGAIDEFRWATALILLVVVLGFYAVGIATRYYFRSKLQHE